MELKKWKVRRTLETKKKKEKVRQVTALRKVEAKAENSKKEARTTMKEVMVMAVHLMRKGMVEKMDARCSLTR